MTRQPFVRPIPVEHLHALTDAPGYRIVHPAPPEIIAAAELEDWELNALHQAGFRLTIWERLWLFLRSLVA
jgi:hypothetical protein